MNSLSTSLTLASASSARRMLLEDAGLHIRIRPVDLDEETLRKACTDAGLSLGKTAVSLAESKARQAASLAEKDELILAADQILDFKGAAFSKPAAISEAREQLLALRGGVHILRTAIVLWRGEKKLWEHLASPSLTMRSFSEEFLDAYLEEEGERILSCVGAYRLEGPCVHLFSSIEGSQDAILGLPRLPLLNELRRMGVLMS